MLKQTCGFMILIATLGEIAGAQASPQPARPVTPPAVVTVHAEPVPLDSLAGSVTTLSRDEIVAANARDAGELLRFLASTHYSQQQGKGSLSTLTIRGGKPNYTLVLIDGIPANDIGDQLGGAFNFATLDADQIDHIDVYRGPLSTIYGSEAIGGVANVVLRSPSEQPRFHLQTEGGQYDSLRIQAGAVGQLRNFHLSASGGISRIGQQVFEDGSKLGSAALEADRTLGSSRALHTFIRWNRLSDSSFPMSSGGPIYALSRLPEINIADQISAGSQFRHKVTKAWSYTASGGVFSRVASDNSPAIFDRIPPGPAYVPSSISHTRFLRVLGATTQQAEPASWISSYTTLSLLHESGTTVGNLGGYLPGSYRLARSTLNLAETVDAHRGRVAVTAGVNLGQASSFGPVFSPHAGVIWAAGKYQLHASYGEGFKLPSFYSLSNPLVGNPALQPEYSTGYDAGIARSFSRTGAQLTLSAFDNSYRNVIDFSPSAFKLVNRENEFARGGDFQARQKIGRVELSAAVTYVDAGLRGTSEHLRDVPRWSEQLQSRVLLAKGSSVQVEAIWVGRRFGYQVPVRQLSTVPQYALVNVNYRKALRKGITGSIRFENVLNSHYQEFTGFPSAGIYTSAGITYAR